MTANKFDQEKIKYHLYPPEALEAVTKVIMFGASKYSERNWEGGMSYSRLFSACMRHMWAWWRGNDIDEESGMSHLCHACTCIVYLITYEERKVGEDDRA